MGGNMELRHLRYFLAVAEAGSLTVAAERRLHTAQPSLSRQMRDLEYEIGTQLMMRSARGIELTAAGRAFLEHVRFVLTQVEAAVAAARRAAQSAKPTFALGFLTGEEMDWLPEAMDILRDELPNIDVTVSSDHSPLLADALMRGKLDLAFLRPEPHMHDLEYKIVRKERLVLILPSDHRLAARKEIGIQEIAKETFVGISKTAPTLRAIVYDFLKRSGVDIEPENEADHLSMAMSLVASTRAVALLPAYAQNLLPWSVISRPLKGEIPTVDLVIGYSKANTSPILKMFLSKSDDLISRVSKRIRPAAPASSL